MEPVNTRVPDELADRLDGLISFVATDPGLRASGARVTRSTVARIALEIGARVLEERQRAGLPPVEMPSPTTS